jgi:hypothetical protein
MDIFDYLISNIFIRTAEEHPVLTIMVISLIIFLIVMYLRLRV